MVSVSEVCGIFLQDSISPFSCLKKLQSFNRNGVTWTNSQQDVVLQALCQVLGKDPDVDLHTAVSKFLQKFITGLEGCGSEVIDGLYELLSDLHLGRQCTYYQPDVSLEEDTAIINYPIPQSSGLHLNIKQNLWHAEVGMKPWAAAYLLTEWLVEHPEKVNGKNILEIGAGVGLTGLMVGAALCPNKLYLTDYVEEVVENLNKNVTLNQKANTISQDRSISVGTLDWCRPELSGVTWSDYDLIIGADVVYNRESIPPLCQAISSILSNGAEVIICMKIRSPLVYELFLKTLQETHIKCEFLQHPSQRFFEYEETIDELKIMKMTLDAHKEEAPCIEQEILQKKED
mmetsp:Transcript_30120/g.39665  ORF Transcript_30120/g.39665 Transcript_30120/m.39665 type:complete len:345 (+) Transcript_30120:129-1163(+)